MTIGLKQIQQKFIYLKHHYYILPPCGRKNLMKNIVEINVLRLIHLGTLPKARSFREPQFTLGSRKVKRIRPMLIVWEYTDLINETLISTWKNPFRFNHNPYFSNNH